MQFIKNTVGGLFYSQSPQYVAPVEEKPKVTQSTSPSITDQIQILTVKRKSILYEADKLLAQAKTSHKANNKKRALKLIEKKKKLENNAMQIEGQIANLEHIQDAIVTTATAHTMVSTMKDSNTIMTQQMETLDIREIETTKAELEKHTENAGELMDILSTPFEAEYNDNNNDDDMNALFDEWDAENEKPVEMPEVSTRNLDKKNVINSKNIIKE